ncbi:MAG: NCS2 family permease [Shewanellaceae bacterium]|nr:NCS2 family permease [Shewanellaceae bacterium]
MHRCFKVTSFLDQFFALSAHKTSVKTEFIAGITTFSTMIYIIFLNPLILAQAGMDRDSVFTATCLAAALGSLIMGLWANYPIAQAPSMSLNAFFTYTVVLQLGYAWQTALGAVFLSGIFFMLLSLTRLKDYFFDAIPMSIRYAMTAGIGLFLALLALKNAQLVVAHPAMLLTLGDVTSWSCLMAVLSLVVILVLIDRGFQAAVFLSILLVTLLSWMVGEVAYQGAFAVPTLPAATLNAMQWDQLLEVGVITLVLSFLLIDCFDTMATLVAVADKAQLLDAQGRLPRLKQALFADATATAVGAWLGTSTTTSYLESAAGVQVGGRTGLTAVVVGLCFILSLWLAPLAQMVPMYASAGALLYVAILMLQQVTKVPWHDFTEAIPAGIICIMLPFSASLITGIGFGFLAYVVMKVSYGRYRELSPGTWLIAFLFFGKFYL